MKETTQAHQQLLKTKRKNLQNKQKGKTIFYADEQDNNYDRILFDNNTILKTGVIALQY